MLQFIYDNPSVILPSATLLSGDRLNAIRQNVMAPQIIFYIFNFFYFLFEGYGIWEASERDTIRIVWKRDYQQQQQQQQDVGHGQPQPQPQQQQQQWGFQWRQERGKKWRHDI